MDPYRTAANLSVLLALAALLRPAFGPSATAQTSHASLHLDTRWITPASDTMLMTREANASPVANWNAPAGVRALADRTGRVTVGFTIETVRRVRYTDRDAFQIDFEQRDSISIVSQTTTWIDVTTLAPVAQTSHLEQGEVATLTFANDSVTILDAAVGRPIRRFAAPLPESAYTAAALDLVLRALPLREGYRAVVPLYFPAEQFVFPLAVRVEGAERVTTRSGRVAECWVLAAEFPGGITERFWIDQTGHTLVRILAHEAATSLVRYDR